jgi:hypothetical protein
VVTFEISVNGERRFVGDDVKAITVVADWIARRQVDRVSVHVGVGGPGEREVQYLGSDLHPGDEISIRVVAEEQALVSDAPEACSFCGSDMHHVRSLVAGRQVAICESCLSAFEAVVTRSAALPLGASIRQEGDARCGFCLKSPPDVAGLLVRNAAAICPECLRACVDITRGRSEA